MQCSPSLQRRDLHTGRDTENVSRQIALCEWALVKPATDQLGAKHRCTCHLFRPSRNATALRTVQIAHETASCVVLRFPFHSTLELFCRELTLLEFIHGGAKCKT